PKASLPSIHPEDIIGGITAEAGAGKNPHAIRNRNRTRRANGPQVARDFVLDSSWFCILLWPNRMMLCPSRDCLWRFHCTTPAIDHCLFIFRWRAMGATAYAGGCCRPWTGVAECPDREVVPRRLRVELER